MLRAFRERKPSVPVSSYVDVSAQVMGAVILGERSSIWMNAVLRGDVNNITIGHNSNIQDCAVIHGMKNLYPVTIGNGVSIGHNACVHGCTIEDDVLIGIGAIVLNGAVVGAGSIIAAGALVPERTIVPPNSLVTGVPGKILRQTTDKDMDFILKTARNYVDYAAEMLQEMEPQKVFRPAAAGRSMSFRRTVTAVCE